jgi:AcrR family transcriptional regulator
LSTASVKRAGAVKTRDRILKAALALFNERGEAHVSLAQIAGRLGISEGNLWYHFRTKHDLVAALFAELEERIERNFSRKPAATGTHLADYADYTRQSFRDIWEYRFLYRHRYDPEAESELAQRIAALIERTHRHTERILAEMVARKLFAASPQEISEIAANAWIISRYWLDYLQERHGLARITEADLQAGVKQLFALYRPHLTDAACAQIAAAHDASSKKKVARG